MLHLCNRWRWFFRLMRLTADIRAPSDTSSAAQPAASPEVDSEQINTPLCTTHRQTSDQALHRGAATESQEEPDVSGGQAQNMQTRTSAQLDLERDFRHEGSIYAQTNGNLPYTPPTWKTDGQGLPLDTPGWLHHSPNSDTGAGRSDDSSPDERVRVQQSPPRLTSGGDDRDTTTLFEIRSAATEQEDRRWRELNVDMNTFSDEPPKATVDEADSTGSTYATGHDENNDSDGPLPNPQRQPRSSTRSTDRAARSYSPSTAQSRSHSMKVGSTKVLRHRKRMHKREDMRRDSLTPDHDYTLATPAMSTSGRETGERWPVQCFFQRKLIGTQGVITIEFPAYDLLPPSEREGTLSSSDQTLRMTPVIVDARGYRRRARFTQVEEDLLIKLEEPRHPKLSWREIKRHFPNRTIGSLQVHFSTQLKGRYSTLRLL